MEPQAYIPVSTIHSFRYLCLRRDYRPPPRPVRALSFEICISAGILNQIFQIALWSQES